MAQDHAGARTEIKRIHVQSHDKRMGRVLQNWLLFSFGWKAAVLLSMRVCQWRLPTFNLFFITKGDGIKYAGRNGTDTFYIFCLPNQRRRGTSVPIGFGPWGNFRMAWGNPVCHWDGVTSGCLG